MFSGAAKQVVMELKKMMDKDHLLVGLEEQKMVTPKAEPKRTLEKRAPTKVVDVTPR